MVRETTMNDAIGASLTWQYSPVAVYYEDADMVEYIRKETPCVNRRIDDFLTLTLDMKDRHAIGFRLKGFKNFYLHYVKQEHVDRDHFLKLVSVLETATKLLGTKLFDDQRREGYKLAYQIAEEDNPDLPCLKVVNG
jgi:predicted nucleic acid-binding protein